MKPTSFLITTGSVQSRTTNISPAYSDEFCSLFLRTHNTHYIQHLCDEEGFTVFIGERTKESLLNNGINSPGQGTLIQYKKASGKLVIHTDRLGTAVLYYTRNQSDSIEISNRLDNLTLAGKSPNWPSVQQYLNTGYTIRSSTFFHGVEQTLPNEKLTASSTDSFQIKRSQANSNPALSMERPNDEQLIDKLGKRLSAVLDGLPSSVLMMSAGWDSRTLLMNGPENYRTAYTHGDLSSREITISRGLTGTLRMDHLFTDLRNLELSNGHLELMLDELGFCVFPVWHIAGQRAQEIYDAPLSSGVLGELMGGHYGLLSMGDRLQKALASLSVLNGKPIRDEQLKKALDLFTTPAPDHWFLSTKGHAVLTESAGTTKAKMRAHLDSIYSHTKDWQRAIETFNMEHRARQYILKQAQAAASTSGYVAPFADDQLVNMVHQIDFNTRVHNKLNQKMLKSKNSHLLDYSMAATLIPAKYPIIFQELSRGVRIALEQTRKILGRNQPRLGWFNYEHLYQSRILHDITDSISLDIWDKSKMHKSLALNPEIGIDAGSTLDMLCKIKTVDYHLRTT
ncbi:hypothetical protein HLV39_02800 [Marinobacter adhaerens]|uniref:Asparagine synthetase domain-containing protein n=1 Tax=Marinobacter adhaerens TaxID=1033846 RepID=A0A851HWM6_9GAMM|nr:hypothetical protein [Marinobacter adhaerens]NWN90428.1 hypothetical protein [Marinobacter adhaerens]